jgi:hypothetical protein
VNSHAKKIDGLQIGAIACVFVHFLLNIAHGAAHGRLGIGLSNAQKIFVFVVIVVSPLVAAYLLWKQKPRAGGALLMLSMTSALLFGIYFHFVLPGPDNVSQPALQSAHHWQEFFVSTAFALAASEALSALLGFVILIRSFAPERGTGASNISGRQSS